MLDHKVFKHLIKYEPLLKGLPYKKRNGVDDLICRRYYSFFVVNYCLRNNMDIPENFIENMFDPDGEFTNDAKTKRAAKRTQNKIDRIVKDLLEVEIRT